MRLQKYKKIFLKKDVTDSPAISSKETEKSKLKFKDMHDLTPIFVTGIIFLTVYKVFDLFVRRKERMALIEKINTEMTGNIDLSKLGGILNPSSDNRFAALKWGCLAVGLGAGMLIGFFIYVNCPMARHEWGLREMMYGALVLIGGGLGLISAFIIEMKVRKPND